MKIKVLFFILISCIACKKVEESKDIVTIKSNDFVSIAETAHSKTDFLKNDAIQFNIIASFGSTEWVNGKMTLATNSSNGKIEFKNGDQIIFNKDKVFCSKSIRDTTSVRFNAYTIPYFFLLPYKLSDKGTVWTPYKNMEADSLNFSTQKLSFTTGTGDAPDDWYVVYSNKKTNLIEKTAYIVTFGGTSQIEAEKEPHAIEYLDYKPVDKIQIATKWKFWGWKKDEGFQKELGNAILSDINFIKIPSDYFNPPTDFIEK
jgi:hypothetical protein